MGSGSGIRKVPSWNRHTNSLRRRAAVDSMITAREKRQKRSQHALKVATEQPKSGLIHRSPRPNRHSSKPKRYFNA